MKARVLLLSLVGLLAAVLVIQAGPLDLFSRPAPAPAWRVGPQDVELSIVTHPSVEVPTLIVPRSLLVNKPEGGRRLGSASPVVGGLALAVAVVTGGLWLAGRRRATALGLLAVAVLGLGAGALLADIPTPGGRRTRPPGPPMLVRDIQPKMVELPASVVLPGTVKMEVVEAGEALQLRLPEKAVVPRPMVLPPLPGAAPPPLPPITPRP